MFTVAPSGRTKFEIFAETPLFSTAQSIVSGRVAEEDAVENAAENAPTAYRDLVGEYFKSLSGSL